MRKTLFILIVLLQIAVNLQAQAVKQNTVIIATEIGDTLVYSNDEFNKITEQHPEFFSDCIHEPDWVYHANGKNYPSEACRNQYYILYAHFLKQKNGAEKYAECRKQLIDIYLTINSLFQRLQYGGTYFGHQGKRILAYAEYAVYRYRIWENNFEKTCDITPQKQLYIQSLRQLIDDESGIDTHYIILTKSEKADRKAELNKTVSDLDKLITNIFYLRRAQEFQYYHYEFY